MEEQSNNADVGTVLLMLDNKCLPPCYCFETNSREVRSMSPEILDDVLEWASQFKPSPPSMMYMVGAPQELDKEVQEVLEDVAGSVICAPMQITEQEKAGLPFSRTQMVVFPSLADFERDNELVKGRSCVVHIGREEISRWSSAIEIQPTEIVASRIRFRPRNLHLWDKSHLKAYRNQFIELEAFKYHLRAAGIYVQWQLGYSSRCPAMRALVTVGPDGLCYPCPTFYYAGQTNGLGAIKTLSSDKVLLQDSKQTCRLCQSDNCEACLFCESGHATGEVNVCELPTGKDGNTTWQEIIWLKDQSGYMFEDFNTAKNITKEMNISLWTAKQVDDISLEDFVNALQTINQTAHALMKGTPEVSENLMSKYAELVESSPKSQRELFSYEQFTKRLEDIHQKAGTEAETSAASYDSVISQYKQSVRLEQVSRKAVFFEKVYEILLGLVDLSEAVSKHPMRSMGALSIRYGISDAEEKDETEKLSLSEHEVTSIRQLYEIFLAWSFLYNSITDALNYDLYVDREIIEAAQREMTDAKAEMNRWFHNTGIKHDWEYREGYKIAVDFESSVNVSSACYIKNRAIDPELENKNWAPLMQLGGIEKEVVERLTMSVHMPFTKVKHYLSQRLAGLDVERDLAVAVKTMGHCVLDMIRWYKGMAKEHNWPQCFDWRINPDWIIEGK